MAFSFRVFRRARPPVAAIAVFAASLALIDRLAPPPLHRADTVSPLILDRNSQWLHAFTTPEGRWRFAADPDTVDQTFIKRLIAVEDKRFYDHPGVDFVAIGRAVLEAVRRGRIVSGASTITMQTARLLEPRARTIPSKIIEMLRALQIERRLSKDEILALYLTLAPYGGNLEGVRAASLAYFGREPIRLTDAEQALLIALPQAPEARRPDRRAQNAVAARARILEALVDRGLMSARHAREAARVPAPHARRPFPRAAYHFARRAARRGPAVVRTRLDLSLQREAERLVRMHADGLTDEATAALVIVDHEEMALRASVGSAGLDAPGGWNDLTRAVRSPGSILKPVIYGLAFDDGLAAPRTVIEDMPRSFGDYMPENFDRRFRGEVRLREALQHSLNVPAVAALDRVGPKRFAAVLDAAGASPRRTRSAEGGSGLALALGGAGFTMGDVAALYAGLANGGAVRPIRSRTDEEEGGVYRIMSAASALRVGAILRDAPALAGRAPTGLATGAPRIAFKTGTSYGYRDAWAAGYGARYAVVAWVGRADGGSRPGATGRKAAAPLVFDAFDMLSRLDRDPGAPGDGEDAPAPALARMGATAAASAPSIVFPRDGVEVFARADAGRALVLAARGGRGAHRWYVDGAAITADAAGSSRWRPEQAGFHEIVVVDAAGRRASSTVRVRIE